MLGKSIWHNLLTGLSTSCARTLMWSDCFLVYSTTKSPNEVAFQIFLDGWPGLDEMDFHVHKAKSRKEKTE